MKPNESMAHDLQQLIDLLARNSGKPDASVWRKANAAHEWRARILFRSQILLEACPLEGLVIRSSTPRHFSEVLPEQAN